MLQAVFNYILHLVLWESYFHIRNDLIYASLISQLRAVQTQIVISCICPFPSGMILIVLRTVLIRLIDKALQFLRAHAMLLRCAFQTIFLRGMNKYAEDIGVILQHIIRTTTDNDAGFLLCQVTDDLRLIVKQVICRCEIIAFRRDQFSVIFFLAI